jgi:hypothetical protein
MKYVFLFLVFVLSTFLIGMGSAEGDWLSRMTGIEEYKKPHVHYLMVDFQDS